MAELAVHRVSERVRTEMGKTHARELSTHEELRQSLAERIVDKDQLIAELRAQIELTRLTERVGDEEVGEPRVDRREARSMKLPALPEETRQIRECTSGGW